MDSDRIAARLGSPRLRAALTGLAVFVALALVGVFVYVEFIAVDKPPKRTSAASPAPPLNVGRPAPTAGAARPTTADGTGSPAASPVPTNTTYTGSDLGGESTPPGSRETAEGFGRAFTNAQGGQRAWFNRLAAFLSADAAERYKNVPIGNVPSGVLLRVDLHETAAVVVEARLTYDSGLVVDVTMAHNAVKWEVVSVTDRVSPGASPEAT
ncbi:hypothetical protein ACFPIJ_58715 [Dactylosporangium cerinum]|uniref:Mce-associated membrane protein n=1 Tax=Dactylosporangium cerinum TaxID=1434730 RepID=A0ABV9WK19_9ACTN